MPGVTVLHTSYWAHSHFRTSLGCLALGGGFELGCRSDPLQVLAHKLNSTPVFSFLIPALCLFRHLPFGGWTVGLIASPTEDNSTKCLVVL